MIRIYEGSKAIIYLTDKAYEVYSVTEPLTIRMDEDGTYELVGAYNLSGLTEDEVNSLLEDDYDLLFMEDDGRLYFPNDDYVDKFFFGDYPVILTLDDIKTLAFGWGEPLTVLMHQVHEATQEEIAEYGKEDRQ